MRSALIFSLVFIVSGCNTAPTTDCHFQNGILVCAQAGHGGDPGVAGMPVSGHGVAGMPAGVGGAGASGHDAGVAGISGHDAGWPGGPGWETGGAGAGGTGGASGAGMGGMSVAGMMAPSMHGGIPVDPALIPAPVKGATTLQVSNTSEKPVKSDEPGAFRTVCSFSHMSWDDPIVFPGLPGMAHLHTFVGNGSTDAFSTAASLKAAGDSTCRGGIANRSAYWFPALIDTRTGRPLVPVHTDEYYKTGYALAPSSIKSFPVGLAAIAGNAAATAPQDTNRVYWTCAQTYTGKSSTIVKCPGGGSGENYDGIQLVVVFPQCSNNMATSPDHKSHLVDPAGGACPADHPTPIPVITIKATYGVADPTGLRLSSDMDPTMPAGQTLHADLIEGWQDGFVDAFVKGCDDTGLDCHSHLLGDGRQLD